MASTEAAGDTHRQGPALLRARLAAPVGAMVEEDDLRDVGQGREPRLVDRVIQAGPSVQEDERRLLTHGGSVGHETGAFDVEEEPDAIDEHVHGSPRSHLRRSYGIHPPTVTNAPSTRECCQHTAVVLSTNPHTTAVFQRGAICPWIVGERPVVTLNCSASARL